MKNFIGFLIVAFSMLGSWSCNGDNPHDSDIIGTWYGTRSYYNPVGGTKYQYLNITFYSDGNGGLEYESPVSYSTAVFTYLIKGNIIQCSGAYASTQGDVEDNFTMRLKIEGNRIIPLEKYTQFILTKDNSVLTDGDGNEVSDQSELLQQIWISTTGETVVQFEQPSYYEYVLTKPYAKTYSSKYEGAYNYDAARKLVNINGVQFDIIELSATKLILKNQNNNKLFSYNQGDESDIPVNAIQSTSGIENGHEWVDLGLPSKTKWATKNIGAYSTTAPGDYFSWGETQPKTNYYEEDYLYFSNGKYIDYLAPDAEETATGRTLLKDEDNAAYVLWGKSWDMPTHAQILELERYCTVADNDSYVTITGPNGQTIKIAKGGYRYGNGLTWNKNIDGYFMSKELKYQGYLGGYPKGWFPVTGAVFKDLVFPNNFKRHEGHNIRPVLRN